MGATDPTVLAEAGERSQGVMEAAWCGWRSAYPCTPSLKAPSDSPIASVRTPCYFYIPVVLLCPRDTQHSRLAAGLSLAPGHCLSLPHSRAHGEAAAERVVGLSVLTSFHGFLLSIVHGRIQLQRKEVFPGSKSKRLQSFSECTKPQEKGRK